METFLLYFNENNFVMDLDVNLRSHTVLVEQRIAV